MTPANSQQNAFSREIMAVYRRFSNEFPDLGVLDIIMVLEACKWMVWEDQQNRAREENEEQ